MDNLGQEGERKRECVRVWVRGNVKERRGGRGEGGKTGLRVILVSRARNRLIPSEFRE